MSDPKEPREWIERLDNPELSDSEREWLGNEADFYSVGGFGMRLYAWGMTLFRVICCRPKLPALTMKGILMRYCGMRIGI